MMRSTQLLAGLGGGDTLADPPVASEPFPPGPGPVPTGAGARATVAYPATGAAAPDSPAGSTCPRSRHSVTVPRLTDAGIRPRAAFSSDTDPSDVDQPW